MITIIQGPKKSGKTQLIHKIAQVADKKVWRIGAASDTPSLGDNHDVYLLDVDFFKGDWHTTAKALSHIGAIVFVEVRDVEYKCTDHDIVTFRLAEVPYHDMKIGAF